jgi:hypothetical protein
MDCRFLTTTSVTKNDSGHCVVHFRIHSDGPSQSDASRHWLFDFGVIPILSLFRVIAVLVGILISINDGQSVEKTAAPDQYESVFEATTPGDLFSGGRHRNRSRARSEDIAESQSETVLSRSGDSGTSGRSDDPLQLPNVSVHDFSDEWTPEELTDHPDNSGDAGSASDTELRRAIDSKGCADEEAQVIRPPGSRDEDDQVNFREVNLNRYTEYRADESGVYWLPKAGSGFGWLRWGSDPWLRRGQHHGVIGEFNIHWFSGPQAIAIPSRVYDFSVGYQVRHPVSEFFSVDLASRVGAFSDFEGSARDGIRFPSHAVGMMHVNRRTDVIFGVDYLDRDDISILPVLGVSLRDTLIDGLRMDLIFPRPQISYAVSDSYRIYTAGRMDGGTWDIEFPDSSGHVMTYRDLRLLFGIEHAATDKMISALEIGYVFGRRLELRDLPGHTDFGDSFVVQWVTRR